MNEQPTVNLYLIDHETDRKLMFKVNPIILGEPENTTILYPDGREFKLEECEASVPVRVGKIIDKYEDEIIKTIAEKFPKQGLPDVEAESAENINKAAKQVISEFINNKVYENEKLDDKTFTEIQLFIDQFRNNEIMVLEEVRQKLSGWILVNRTMPYYENEQKKLRLDDNYALDYTKRQIKAFKKVNTELANKNTVMTFLEAIATIGTVYNSLSVDTRRHFAQDKIASVIKYYQPIQIMQQEVVRKLVECEKDKKCYLLNQIDNPADIPEGQPIIDKKFWEDFTDAMKKCQLAAEENLNTFLKAKAFANNEANLFDTIIKLLKGKCNEYIAVYNEYKNNIRNSVVENDNTAIVDIQNIIHSQLMEFSDSLIDIAIKFEMADENKQLSDSQKQLLYGLIDGVPLTIKHHQNQETLYTVIYDLINQFNETVNKVNNTK